ncbi:MAG: hypothetical protein WCS70_04885 [Verrucomicrobiota bacterium]
MADLFSTADRLLRGDDEHAAPPVRSQLLVIAVFGAVYGAVMGSYGGLAGDGWKQALVSAIKVPWLFSVTFLLCLPSFFVLNVLAGLAGDFRRVLNALLSFQAIAALVLSAVTPITFLFNVSTDYYQLMVLWNGVAFAVASITGHIVMRRLYRTLIAGNPRHRLMYRVWMGLYVFVGIEMGWVLRPFIGDPNLPVQFFRRGAWGNAYMELLRIFHHVLGG